MQEVKYLVSGSAARCISGNLVNDEDGVLALDFGGTDGRLSFRINNAQKQTVSVIKGKAYIPSRVLSAGVMRAELYTEKSKVICEPLRIASYFEENRNRFTACPDADDILERLVSAEEELKELKQEYERRYTDVLNKLDDIAALLKKINKSYNLGLFGGK